jgi:ABC-type enterobactin transport system permease subunit
MIASLYQIASSAAVMKTSLEQFSIVAMWNAGGLNQPSWLGREDVFETQTNRRLVTSAGIEGTRPKKPCTLKGASQ